MNILTLDVETTISNKGNPYDKTNKLVCVGIKWLGKAPSIFYEDQKQVDIALLHADVLVGFNIKFDLHWLNRIGIVLPDKLRVWDGQLAEFLLSNQENKYPSLDDAALKYGFTGKHNIVKEQYWDKGIDTDKIPVEILSEYLEQDLKITEEVFKKQYALFETTQRGLKSLFYLQCRDLLTLFEMEKNGILFNTEKALEKADTIQKELNETVKEIHKFTDGVPINLNSNDHLSCLLYGGTIVDEFRIPIGVYKSGEKTGQVRYKVMYKDYILPRIVEPIKGSEVKKSTEEKTYWKVDAITIRKLKLNKTSKIVIDLLSRYNELEKLRGTYLIGYTELIKKMNWPDNMLHGTLNQCVAITGRLSSSKPNLQNADPITKTFMESRYGESCR